MNEPRAHSHQRRAGGQPRDAAAPGSRPCQECGAPMERQPALLHQLRGAPGRRANPASRYFAAASRQRRALGGHARPRRRAGKRDSRARAAGVFFFALLPIAVAVGVLVGRSGPVRTTKAARGARDGSGAAGDRRGRRGRGRDGLRQVDELLASDFSLDKGFTVKLGLLPIDGTDQGAADDGDSEAESKGAKDVGIINPGDFTTTPTRARTATSSTRASSRAGARPRRRSAG